MIYSLGFLAQILFSYRLITQWITSEKHKKSVTPRSFWIVSLIASFLLFIYGYLRLDFAIMFGQILMYFIYVRNLQLERIWNQISIFYRSIICIIPVILIFYYFNNNQMDLDLLFKNKDIPSALLILGIIAQFIFTFRFIYQWIYSEKKKKSQLPFGFWLLSLIGSLLILIYAVLRNDPVLLLGHCFGLIIYGRNLYLYNKNND